MASNNDFLPVCPTDCTTLGTVPIVSDNCLSEAGIEAGEITDVIFCEAGVDPTLPATPITGHVMTGLSANATVNSAAITSWFDGIDNATGNIVHFEVIGNMPEPTITTAVGAKKQEVITSRKRIIEIDIVNKTNRNYAFAQQLECGWAGFVWFGTEKFFYGGINGIRGRVSKVTTPLERGDGLSAIKITFEWGDARTNPPRDAKPFL